MKNTAFEEATKIRQEIATLEKHKDNVLQSKPEHLMFGFQAPEEVKLLPIGFVPECLPMEWEDFMEQYVSNLNDRIGALEKRFDKL